MHYLLRGDDVADLLVRGGLRHARLARLVLLVESSFCSGGMRMNVGVEGQDRAPLASFS